MPAQTSDSRVRVPEPSNGTERTPPPSPPLRPLNTGEDGYPVVYYNPLIPDERFRVPGSGGHEKFVGGRYVAIDAAREQAVRNALVAHGRDKPDRWKGDDLRREWTCKHCGFHTANLNAQDDHELSNRH